MTLHRLSAGFVLLAAFGRLLRAELPPAFSGDALPEPQQQHAPWNPPATKLPHDAVSAVAQLFGQGFADPRGCEYREIEVLTGSVWGGVETTKTRGWVLPGTDAPRFAIAWNGLVYPAQSVGAARDVRRDARAAIATGADANPQIARESQCVSIARPRRLMIPLLLRLGHADLAGKMWAQLFDNRRKDTGSRLASIFAGEWRWTLFDRALTAHQRGDDRLALNGARGAAAVKTSDEDAGAWWREKLTALIADSERRIAEPARIPVLLQTPPPAGAGLIRDLEFVAATQRGQPGFLNPAEDRIVRALIDEGEAAVEPLLDCFENDRRLTRSVRFWRDFSDDRTILGVHEAAYAALAGILQASFFGFNSTGDSLTARGDAGRAKIAAQLREHWRKFKGVPFDERWYRTLADDAAGAARWIEAAENIVRPADEIVNGGVRFIPFRTRGVVPSMTGESLRAKAGPSVAELLARRLRELAGASDDDWDHGLCATNRIAFALARWDGKENADALRDFSAVMVQRLAGKTHTRDQITRAIAGLFGKRMDCGDARAFDEYAEWIAGIVRRPHDDPAPVVFQPMWRHPDQPAIAAAAERMFARDGSPWRPLFHKGAGAQAACELMRTPLAGVSAFRKDLQLGLRDRTPIGTARITRDGWCEMTVDDGWIGGDRSFLKSDPLAPPRGTKVRFRICDLYANTLAELSGTPRCGLCWPEAARDRACAECAELLARYGDRYRDESDATTAARWFPGDETRMTFPPLDRPATREDVAAGRAIFSLEGERRIVKLPSFSLAAKWSKLRDRQFLTGGVDPKTGKGVQTLAWDEGGEIWQAEEVNERGQWRRYYGFVSRYRICRVPAGELQFSGAAPP